MTDRKDESRPQGFDVREKHLQHCLESLFGAIDRLDVGPRAKDEMHVIYDNLREAIYEALPDKPSPAQAAPESPRAPMDEHELLQKSFDYADRALPQVEYFTRGSTRQRVAIAYFDGVMAKRDEPKQDAVRVSDLSGNESPKSAKGDES
jgi:hypothetical protein